MNIETILFDDVIEIRADGKKVPDKVVNSILGRNFIKQVNNRVYINGYEFRDGEWKRTFAALWNLLF